jgi:hypothetical protein
MGYMKRGDFYEEDEPVENVVAAFDAGSKFATGDPAEPTRGWNTSLGFGSTYGCAADRVGILTTETHVRSRY